MMPRTKVKLDTTGKLEEDVRRLNAWMIGVIIVLGISFAGVFIAMGAIITDTIAEKKAVSQDTRDEIKSQNDKIEGLTEEIIQLNNIIKANYEQKTTQETN